MRELTFFVPQLFGPDSATTVSVPSLETLLRFGSMHTIPSEAFSSTLFRLFGIENIKTDYPVAAVTHLADNGNTEQEIWLRADPIHLRAENNSVLLMDHTAFSLSQYETLVLIADIKEVLTQHGLKLEAPAVDRWYIKLKQLPNIKTTPIHEVVGKDIYKYLPTGKGKAFWDRLASEIQMSLHGNPLNIAREKRGDLLVNGLWLWGSGTLPEKPKRIWQQVFGDETITQGLCSLSGAYYESLPDNFTATSERSENENVLIVLSSGQQYQQYSDVEGWQNFIKELEDKWLTPILEALRNKKLAQLTLLTNHKRLVINQASFIKFWRKHKALHLYR